MKKSKGFTLIEMLIVVTILGILAAIVLPRFAGSSDDARKKAHITERTFHNTQIALLLANEGSLSATADTFGELITLKDYYPTGANANCNKGTAWGLLDANTSAAPVAGATNVVIDSTTHGSHE